MNTSRHRAASMVVSNHNLHWEIRPKVKLEGTVILSRWTPIDYFPSHRPLPKYGFAMLISECWRPE